MLSIYQENLGTSKEDDIRAQKYCIKLKSLLGVSSIYFQFYALYANLFVRHGMFTSGISMWTVFV